MNSIKVVAGFFTKTSATVGKAKQREIAKESGKKIKRIDVVDAYRAYHADAFFRSKIAKFGRPEPGQFIVVVYYKPVNVSARKKIKPKPIDMIEPATQTIPLPTSRPATRKISEGAAKAKTVLIALSAKNNTHLVKRSNRTIEFMPNYSMELIA